MDMPDSSDYWEDVRDQLIKKGTPAEDILSISAATGLGIIELVRRLHRVLDDLPEVCTSSGKPHSNATCLPHFSTAHEPYLGINERDKVCVSQADAAAARKDG